MTEAEIETDRGWVRVSFPTADTVRVRLSRRAPNAEAKPLPSFAVTPPGGGTGVPFAVEETDADLVARTERLALRVTRRPLQLALVGAGGETIWESAAPVAWGEPGLLLSWRLPPGQRVLGLGDKAKGMERRGQWFELWNHDSYGWTADTDPLYKSIPFVVLLDGGRAHGVFVDSPAHAIVDVGDGKKDLVTWKLDRGEAIDLYLFGGPEPHRVVESFTALTGRMPLPPRWALGHHQSRYSYESEAEVRELAARLRAERVPTDAIWLDIDFQDRHAPFTIDRKAFPDFAGMVSTLRQVGLRTVVITDPHLAVRPGEEPYASALAGDHLVRTPDGGVFTGEVWPGKSAFPELSLSRTRAWWGGLYRGFLDDRVAGFWDDMNEPALFEVPSKTMPSSTPHRLDDGRTVDHAFLHNAYGALQSRATYEGLLALRPAERPFVLTRAAYAGTQRWAATWTGDNVAGREGLALTIPTLTNLGVSGFALVGADVGGFVGCPDPDLLTAWMEAGALQPFFRNHSAKEACRREPWVNGDEQLRRRRAAVERRYRLLPFLYTLFEESSRTGLPVMRPLWLEYPADALASASDRAWLLGRDLLVAPRLDARPGPYPVALPAGAWWDVSTGALVEGGRRADLSPPEGESLVVLARAGAIVPQAPVVQHTGAAPEGPLTVEVWPGGDCAGSLYLDDGASFAYREGALRRVSYGCRASEGAVSVTATSEGTFATWWSSTEVVVHGVPRAPREVTSGSSTAPSWRWDEAHQAAIATVPGDGAAWDVSVRW